MTTIRLSRLEDLATITAICAHAVRTDSGGCEIDSPDATETARRRHDLLAKGLPYLLAETGAGVKGYAYASPFRPCPAYRFSVENSVALHTRLGFQPADRFDQVGRKFDHWLDEVLMQRALGPGAALPPPTGN